MASSELQLSRLDLNLLVSLDALLTERSVTRAAERLGLGQPALSASLARLRTHFNDEILARQGNNYQLTPLAVRLSEHTAVALEAAGRVFNAQGTWDAHESTREFTIFGSDYAFSTTGHVAAALAEERAPDVRFRFVAHTPDIVLDAPAQLRSYDALIIPHGFMGDLPFADLNTDRWVILASTENRTVGDELTVENMTELPWVFTYQSRSVSTSGTRQMQQLGIEPQIACVVDGFLAMPSFIAGTQRLGMIQGNLADFARRQEGIRVLETPFVSTPIVNAIWWHPIHDRDPGHAWMRALFAEAGAIVERASAAALVG
jgi:LysR family transcriptional regulator, nod-box dependent transcriptional activator